MAYMECLGSVHEFMMVLELTTKSTSGGYGQCNGPLNGPMSDIVSCVQLVSRLLQPHLRVGLSKQLGIDGTINMFTS